MPEWKFGKYPIRNRIFVYSRENSYILPLLGKMDVRGKEVIRGMNQGFSVAFWPHTTHADAYAVYHELLKCCSSWIRKVMA